MEEITINFAPRQKLPPGFRVEWWIDDEHYHWVNEEGECSVMFSSRWQAYRDAWGYYRHFTLQKVDQ